MRKIRKNRIKVIATTLLSLFLFNVSASAKQFQIKNTSPVAGLSADVLHQKKLDVNLLTDYTGQKSTDVTSKLNQFKADMFAKGVDVNLNTVDGYNTVAKSCYGFKKVIHGTADQSLMAALKADGTVWTWNTSVLTPTQITGITNVIDIITMGHNIIMLTKGGELYSYWVGRTSAIKINNIPNNIVQIANLGSADNNGQTFDILGLIDSSKNLYTSLSNRSNYIYDIYNHSFTVNTDISSVDRFVRLNNTEISYVKASDGTLYKYEWIVGTGVKGSSANVSASIKFLGSLGYIHTDYTFYNDGRMDIVLNDGNYRTTDNFSNPQDVIKVTAGGRTSASSYYVRYYVLYKDGTLWEKVVCSYDPTLSQEFKIIANDVADVEASFEAATTGYSVYHIAKKDGTLWGFGENEYGLVGNGSKTPFAQSVPNLVKIADGSTANFLDFSNSLSYKPRQDSDHIFIHLSDGVGNDFSNPFGQYYSLMNLNKSSVNSLVTNNYSIYSLTPAINFDYILPESTSQDTTIRQMINSSPIEGKLYDSTSTGGLAQLDILLNDLKAKYNNNTEPLFPTSATPNKNVDIKVLTDYSTGSAQYSDLVNKINNIKPSLFPYNVNFSFNSSTDVMNNVLNIRGIKQVESGWYDTSVVTQDGSLYVVGKNENTLLDNSVGYNIPVQVFRKVPDIPKVAQISSGMAYGNKAIVTTDGDLYTIGTNSNGETGLGYGINSFTKVPNLPKISQVSCGESSIFALTTDGDLYVTGDNYNGNLGLGDNINRNVFTKVPNIPKVAQVSGGAYFTSIITTDGDLYVTGQNSWGQLGLGDTVKRTIFTKVSNIPKVSQVSSGSGYNSLVTIDGDLYVTGSNYYGNLGLGDTIDRNIFTKVPNMPKLLKVNSCWGDTYAVTTNNDLYVTGRNGSGELGLGNYSSVSSFTKVPGVTNILQISGGYAHNIMLTINGDLYATGDNGHSEIGLDSATLYNIPTLVPNTTKVSQVSGYMAIGIIDKSGNLYTTGYNNYGQLGLGNPNVDRYTYNKVPGIPKASQFSSNELHSAIVTQEGDLYVAGYDALGELALSNSGTNVMTFTKVPNIPKVKQVECGSYTTIVLTTEGDVYVVGYNYYGQLGLGDTVNRTTFTKVPNIPKIASIEAFGNSTALITTDGDLYVTGFNNYGELGLGDKIQKNTFTKVPNIPKVSKISIGTTHSALITTDNSLYVSGYNIDGSYYNGSQIGLAYTQETTTFTKISGIPSVMDVSAGDYHTAALTTDGHIYVTGGNSYNHGELGLGNVFQTNVFTEVPGISNIVKISTGGANTFAIDSEGLLYYTGSNISGAFGSGNISSAYNANKFIRFTPTLRFENNKYLDPSLFPTFSGNSEHYLLYVGDGKTLQKLEQTYKQTLLDNNVKFLAVTPDSSYFNQSVGCDTYSGLASSTNGATFTTADDSVNYIINKYTELVDTRKSGYLVADEDKLQYNKSYNDYERDTQNINTQYAERWRYSHDNTVFENDQGVINNNNLWSLVSTIFKNEESFSKVGKYIVSYQAQDNPALNNKGPDGSILDESKFSNYRQLSLGENQLQAYVNRRPIAQFAYNLNGTQLTVTNTSLDLDHLSHTDKGIVQSLWRYKKLNDISWTKSQTPPTTLDAGETYELSLVVKDEDGFISKPYTQILGVQGNNPPTALFKLDVNQMTKGTQNNITDQSYDPENDPLVEYHWWITDILNTYTIKDYGQVKPDLSTLDKGNYSIHLKVRDNPASRGLGLTSLWSDEYMQPLQVGINNPPIASFLMNSTMYKGDINYIKDLSYDPDGDDISDRHWWILDSTGTNIIKDSGSNIPDLSTLDIGKYKIKLVVTDTPTWGLPMQSIPCIKDLTVIDKATSQLDVDADPKSSEWVNKDISPIISVTGGYNYKNTQYNWSKTTEKPSVWSTSTASSFITNQSGEGVWYLHMNANDELTSVYKYRGPYKIDKTAPDISFSLSPGLITDGKDTGTLQVIDTLSGVKDGTVIYQWFNTDEQQSDLAAFITWNGEAIVRPSGSKYLHVQALDNAGNPAYQVFGPYSDPLKLVNFRISSMVNPPNSYTFPITLPYMPAECKSGYNNTLEINVEGTADSITVNAKDSSGNNLGTIDMTKEYDIDSSHSVWKFDFATDLDTPSGTIIKFNIVGQKGSLQYDYNLNNNNWDGSTLKIKGSALDDTMIYRRY